MKFIVDFDNNATVEQIDEYLQQQACVVIKEYDLIGKIFLVECNVVPEKTAIVESVINDDESQLSLMEQMKWSTTSDDDWWKIASASKPDLSAYEIFYDRPVVSATVYLVDSGIKLDHPEFANARVTNLFAFNGDVADYNGHGTALASVMVGSKCGIVDAQVKSVKIFQSGTPTLLSDLLSAFDAILADSITSPTMKIINLSWVIAKNSYVESKIQLLIDSGMIVVCSAGNSGAPIEAVTPAAMQDAITVGAYDQDFTPCDFSNYTGYLQTTENTSNYGILDVWAPGIDIQVANLDGSLSSTAGTSVAAAIHSAAIAFDSYITELSNGETLAIYNSKELMQQLACNKAGILILDGVYAQSINKISAIRTEKHGENDFTLFIPTTLRWVVKSGVEIGGLFVFPKSKIASYNASALPSGLSIDSGIITGTLYVDEPEIMDIDIPFTTTAGEYGNMKLTLVVLPEGMETNDPSLSQEIAIKLLAGCNSGICGDTCSNPLLPNCADCSSGGKGLTCVCVGEACEPV